MTALDWPGLMQAGMSGLRLTPGQFWALTPAELSLMLGGVAQVAPPIDRAALETLARRFPDKGEGDDRK